MLTTLGNLKFLADQNILWACFPKEKGVKVTVHELITPVLTVMDQIKSQASSISPNREKIGYSTLTGVGASAYVV